jgi:hypothetical protein
LTRYSLRLALAASLMSASAAHAAIFTDTFETYTTSSVFETFSTALAPIGGGVATWSVGGDVDVVSTSLSGFGTPASQGNYVLDLNGTGTGSITALFGGLVANQQYRVAFQYAGNMAGDLGIASRGFDVGIVGGASQFFDNPTTTFAEGAFTFTATGAFAQLRFAGTTQSNYGGVIDNISVAAVPEPHEWAMMLAGLGLVGWAARRRRGEQSGTASMGAAA